MESGKAPKRKRGGAFGISFDCPVKEGGGNPVYGNRGSWVVLGNI